MNIDNNSSVMDTVKVLMESIEEPVNLFYGKQLPKNICLPDNLLIFNHNYCESHPHSHFRYTLVFPLSSMTYYIDQQEFKIFPDSMLLIRPHQLRYLHPDSAGYDRLFITFELPEPQPYFPVDTLNQLTKTTGVYLQRFIEYYLANRTVDAAIELVYLLKTFKKSRTNGSVRTVSSIVAGAISYINENLHRQFGNQDIACAVKVSESNLRLRFKKETGMTLSRYIAKHRLEAAMHRLKHSDMNIEEIAFSCGYNTVYAFSHFFKNNIKISPKFYRQQFKKGEK